MAITNEERLLNFKNLLSDVIKEADNNPLNAGISRMAQLLLEVIAENEAENDNR